AWKTIKLPEDKILIPGVIASSINYVEHPEGVAQRLLRYADVVGRERLMAGSDCGFGTFAGFGPVFPAFAWMKFRALAEGAKLASGKLWGRAA
ncbi:MAG: epoxyalkane--coenzyme M transferase, partial [Acidobacteriota bacterium]|nr:epoxyalkane--coenzyme M transferase [Acidobacteriota bacterium]